MDHSFDSGTNGSVSVGSSSTLVLNKNSGRKYALLINDSNETIYLALGNDAVSGQGIRLCPNGGALEIDGTQPFTGLIRAICASGGKNLSYFEA